MQISKVVQFIYIYIYIYLLAKGRVEKLSGSTGLALKSARIVDVCSKSIGFADFENIVESGTAVNFGADSGFCLS